MLIEKLAQRPAQSWVSARRASNSSNDILIENNQCRGQTEIYSQVLSSLMDARASIISNNLNLRIKALTILTIAIMLPTLIVSVSR